MRARYLIVGLMMVAGPALAEPSVFAAPVRSITASGMAERKVVPDEAVINVIIGVTKAELAAAKVEHDKKLRNVMDIAAKANIDKAQVKTLSSYTQRLYTWDGKKRTFKGYRVGTNIQIAVKNVNIVGELQEKLNAAGLENDAGQQWNGPIVTVNYHISKPDEVRDEILAEAIKNARKKADNMAEAAGTSVSGVIRIEEAGTSTNMRNIAMMSAPHVPLPRMVMDKTNGAAEETTQMETEYLSPPLGEETINATVTVIFELK